MIYEEGHVQVDDHFARFGSKSYAIDKINSVDVREEKRTSSVWIIAALAAVVIILIWGNSVGGWVVALIAAGFSVYAYRNRPKPIYHLMLATSSGEVQATNSGDEVAVSKLRNAIETAMMRKTPVHQANV